MDPSPTQADPPMSRAVEKVWPEERSYVAENLRCAGWMKPVAPVVEPLALPFEAPGIPTHRLAALYERNHCGPLLPQSECGTEPRGSSAEDYDVRSIHAYGGEIRWVSNRLVGPDG
jgi:hypothetical protein